MVSKTQRLKVIDSWRVLSSKGTGWYTVNKYEDSSIWCSCAGFKYRRSCRHTKDLGLVK